MNKFICSCPGIFGLGYALVGEERSNVKDAAMGILVFGLLLSLRSMYLACENPHLLWQLCVC